MSQKIHIILNNIDSRLRGRNISFSVMPDLIEHPFSTNAVSLGILAYADRSKQHKKHPSKREVFSL